MRMTREPELKQRVKAANRDLYDAVAEHYEAIDGRRSAVLEAWLKGNLSRIRQKVAGGSLLDIGTGNGFVTRCAEGIFDVRIGVDISAKILAASQNAFNLGVTADIDHLPFADGSVDVITCFAVLHHLYDFTELVAEVGRVLKPGGIFYSDHDMDAMFHKRFSMLLKLYRTFHNAKAAYREVNEMITSDLYHLTEFQEDGINTAYLISLFEQSGFSVATRFHWFGLSLIIDRIIGTTACRAGWAPLFSAIAQKGRNA